MQGREGRFYKCLELLLFSFWQLLSNLPKEGRDIPKEGRARMNTASNHQDNKFKK